MSDDDNVVVSYSICMSVNCPVCGAVMRTFGNFVKLEREMVSFYLDSLYDESEDEFLVATYDVCFACGWRGEVVDCAVNN